MSDIGRKLREERKRRRERLKQQKGSGSGWFSASKSKTCEEEKFSKEDRDKGNKLAMDYANNLNNKIDKSMDNSLKMLAETDKVAMDTAQKLDEQRHQIRNIHKNLHETDEHLKESDRNLQTIEGWVGGAIVMYIYFCLL